MLPSYVYISVVVPVYNEEENIPELYGRLTDVLQKTCGNNNYPEDSYEIIMVDDGSADASWQLIKELRGKDKKVKGISFSRNFGHHTAVLAGLDIVQGELTVLMDADLQDLPEEIPLLIAKAKEGFDIVQAASKERHSNVVQRVFSNMFRKVFMANSTVDAGMRLGMFRALKRPVVDSIKRLGERNIFFGGIVSWVGFKGTSVAVKRGERHAGNAKYSALKRAQTAINAIVSFTELPLVILFYLGGSIFLLSLLAIGSLVFNKIFFGTQIIGWTSTMIALFFTTGLLILSMSVIGLYVSKLYIEIKQRPRYIVREIALDKDEP